MPVTDGTGLFDPARKSYLKIELPVRRALFRRLPVPRCRLLRRLCLRRAAIYVKPPTKTAYEGLLRAAEINDAAAEGRPDGLFTDCYEPVAAAMSNNRDGVIVTAADLDAAGIDVSDIGEFLAAYMVFMSGLAEAKN